MRLKSWNYTALLLFHMIRKHKILCHQFEQAYLNKRFQCIVCWMHARSVVHSFSVQFHHHTIFYYALSFYQQNHNKRRLCVLWKSISKYLLAWVLVALLFLVPLPSDDRQTANSILNWINKQILPTEFSDFIENNIHSYLFRESIN